MSMRKIILKGENGTPIGVATLRGDEEALLILPAGYRATRGMLDGKMCLLSPGGRLPFLPKELTFLGEGAQGESFYASTLPHREAAFEIHLLRCLEEPARKSSLNTPLRSVEEDASEEKPISTPAPMTEEESVKSAEKVISETTSPSEIEEEPSTESKNGSVPAEESSDQAKKRSLLAKAEERLHLGTPFPLFEQLIEGSEWAKIADDDSEWLIGIVREGEDARILYGIPGTRDFPPDEDRLWTFFPIDEETGYYLTEDLGRDEL